MGWRVVQIRANEVKAGDVIQAVRGRGNWYQIHAVETTPTDAIKITFKHAYYECHRPFNLVNKQVPDEPMITKMITKSGKVLTEEEVDDYVAEAEAGTDDE